jgi:hypothetical protein
VIEVLSRLVSKRDAPLYLRLDNGPDVHGGLNLPQAWGGLFAIAS